MTYATTGRLGRRSIPVQIENLQLDGFKTAVHVTGAATLTGMTVTASQIGVLADGTAKLTAAAVTFAGTSGQCNVGVRAADTAQVAVDTIVATNLIAVYARCSPICNSLSR